MLCRVFQNIDNEKMAAHRSASADVLRKEISASATDIICIDGKAMRGALYDNGRNPDIVSAYSLRSGFILATDVCKEKSNEINIDVDMKRTCHTYQTLIHHDFKKGEM